MSYPLFFGNIPCKMTSTLSSIWSNLMKCSFVNIYIFECNGINKISAFSWNSNQTPSLMMIYMLTFWNFYYNRVNNRVNRENWKVYIYFPIMIRLIICITIVSSCYIRTKSMITINLFAFLPLLIFWNIIKYIFHICIYYILIIFYARTIFPIYRTLKIETYTLWRLIISMPK